MGDPRDHRDARDQRGPRVAASPRSSRRAPSRATPSRSPSAHPAQPVPAARPIRDEPARGSAASVAEHGVLQPILRDQTPTATSSSRASAGCAPRSWPASTASRPSSGPRTSRQQLGLALVENLQRADLNAMDEAARVPAAHRRVRAHPGAGRAARRALPRRDRQHAAAARRRAGGPGGRLRTDGSPRATRVRSPAWTTTRSRCALLGRSIERGAVRPPDGAARAPEARRRAARRSHGRRPAGDPDLERMSAACAMPSARKVTLTPGTRRAAGSPSSGTRGRPDAPVRAPDGRTAMSDRRTTAAAAGDATDAAAAPRRQGRATLRRRVHPGPRGPRGGPAAARACTSARPTSAACTTSSGRSSTTPSTRRWPGMPRTSRSRIQRRRQPPQHRQRPRRPGRAAEADRTRRARGGAHRAPRRRQVRRRRLQGLGRPPRRRRQRRQRAVGVAAGRDRHATARSGARSTSAASPTGPVKARRPVATAGTARPRVFMPDAQVFETLEFSFDTIAQRLRESAYLTKGVQIRLVDERASRRARRTSTSRAASSASCATSTRTRTRSTRDRSPSSGGTARPPSRSRIQYNDSFAETVLAFANNIHTVDGGTHVTGFRAAPHQLPQRLGAHARGSSRTPRTTCRARTSARA